MYLAHPVAPTTEEIDRYIADQRDGAMAFIESEIADPRSFAAQVVIRRNVDRACRWLHFLVVHTGWTISAPWIAYVMALDDTNPAHRARGTADSQALAKQCAGIVMVGGRISNGMRADALACDGPMLDLTRLGPEPPWRVEDGFRPELAEEIAQGWRRARAGLS